MTSKTVAHIVTGLDDGGAEGVLYRLCVNDKSNRHVVISMMGSGKYGPLLEAEGVEVVQLDMPQGKITFKGLLRLWKTLRRIRPDVVQTWLYHADLIGGVVSRLAGVRAVFWGIRHGNPTEETVKRSTVLVAKASALLSRLIPRRIVSCSKEAVANHVAIGYDERRFVVIPNGYDLTKFQPQESAANELKRALELPKDVFLIGMVARFVTPKDHKNLLSALAYALETNPSIVCLLVGTGMERSNSRLMQWATAAGCEKQLRFLGRRTDIPAVMSALDVHVLSSFAEGFPNVIAEAMVCGTPCVTTVAGDAPLIVGDTGWVVPAQDSRSLGDAICFAAEAKTDEASWKKRCEAARYRVVEQFSIEQMVKSYWGAWEA